MTEVQHHGFAFERWVKETFFEPFEADYTQKWDVPAEKNCRNEIPTKFQNLPVSIKTAKFGSPIGLGDAIRQFSIDEDFLLIVGFWEQQGNQKHIVAAEAVKASAKSWKDLWSPIERADLERLDKLIKNARSYQTARNEAKAMKKESPYCEAKIVLNPKIDSKSQRRLQCSLPFKTFWGELSQREPYQSDSATLFGKLIPNPFSLRHASSRRNRLEKRRFFFGAKFCQTPFCDLDIIRVDFNANPLPFQSLSDDSRRARTKKRV